MIRVAFVGKGGAGKSTIAGTFARLLAQTGEPVIALDSDPLPGLPYALGVAVDDRPIPDFVVVEGPAGGPRWVLRPELDASSFVERYAPIVPDGVYYLQFGNTSGHISMVQRAQHAWSQVVRELDPNEFHLVGDLPGGTRQAMFGWGRYANLICIVVEPSVKSLHSARRLLKLDEAKWAPEHTILVANKVRQDDDVERIEKWLGRSVSCQVPLDPEVAAADRQALAPLDGAPKGPFVAAVGRLVEVAKDLSEAKPLHEAPGGA